MIRAFIALPVPDPIRDQLTLAQTRLPIARTVDRDNFHVTLAFLGEQPEDRLVDLHDALEGIEAPGFALHIAGLDVFGGDKPRSVHARLGAEPLLSRLQGRIARAALDCGLRIERRRFTPHITLGRYAPGEGRPEALAHAIATIGVFTSPPWPVDHYAMIRSRLRPEGPLYDELASYPLTV